MTAPSRGAVPEPPAADPAPEGPAPAEKALLRPEEPAADAAPGAEVSGVSDVGDANDADDAPASGADSGDAPADTPEPAPSSDAEALEAPETPDEAETGETEAPEAGAAPGTSASDTDDAPGADSSAEADDGAAETDSPAETGASAEADEPSAPAGPSEAEAEIAAQRELRAKIEQRKAEKDGPVASGAGLSGKAADLLAAVRAVESGERPGSAFYDSPAPAAAPPAPRQAEPAPPRPPAPRSGQPPARGAARVSAPETVAAVREVLLAGGAPEALVGRVAETLGERAAEALREDPWRLLSVPGVLPEQADGFARALLGGACGPGDERRTAALVVWELERAALSGHTALDAASVYAALGGRSVPDPEGAVERAVAEGVVLAFGEEPAEPEGLPDEEAGEGGADGEHGAEAADEPSGGPVLLCLDRYALAEESLADGLFRLATTGADERWAQPAPDGPPRSPGVSELAAAVAACGLVVHTGGEAARAEPVALAGAAAALGLRAVVAVHSERGRRAADGAVSVAGLLAGLQGPGRDEDGAWALDLLIVLDAQLLDVESAAVLVESLPDGGRLLLSGDPAQLGPAGAGRVLVDLLAARSCPRIASRLPDPGPIGELVSGVGAGELNQVAAPGREVVIVPVRDAGEAVHRTVQLVADSVPRAFGVPAGETQVITVGHCGSAGARVLNAALKQRLNPGPGRFAGFDPGDRVAYAPAPGRTVPGTVLSADAAGLRLECEGVGVSVPRERVESTLRHGWALTAHQAAGMRWEAAVVVLPGDAAQGLSRPWAYTAFGRGERHLSVVHGVDRALERAVAEIPAPERTTRLRELLEKLSATTV